MNKSFLEIIFFIFILTLVCSSKLGRWVDTPISTTSPNLIPIENNDPWFADYSNDYTCSSTILSHQDINMIGVNRMQISTLISGGIGSAACFSFSYQNQSHEFAIKISSLSKVYDFDFKWYCGNFQKLETEFRDKDKPDITNGVSCHCPGSLYNSRFSECEQDFINGTMTFVNGLPFGNTIPKAFFCHSLATRGPAIGCDFDQNAETDYFLKFSTQWEFLPAFRLKERSILESVYTVFLDGVAVQNISLSPLDPTTFNILGETVTASLVSSSSPTSLLTDFVVMSSTSNFTDPDEIYLIKTDRYNNENEFNPLKYCPMRKDYTSPIEYRKWDIDTKIIESFLPIRCDSPYAQGNIQPPFPNMRGEFITAQLLSSRINPTDFALFPGDTTLMKVRTQGSFEISITFNELLGNFTFNQIDFDYTDITAFTFSCDASQNQDGFRCHLQFQATNKSQVQIKSKDANYVIANINCEPGLNRRDIMVNPIYTSSNQVTLCASGTWNPTVLCHTTGLNYNFTNDITTPNITDPNINNGDTGSGDFLHNPDGKLKGWAIGVITVLSVIGFVIFFAITWPMWVILYKGLKIVYCKTRESLMKFHKKIINTHDNLENQNESQNIQVIDNMDQLSLFKQGFEQK